MVGFLIERDAGTAGFGQRAVFLLRHREDFDGDVVEFLSGPFDAFMQVVEVGFFGAFAGEQQDLFEAHGFDSVEFGFDGLEGEGVALGVAVGGEAAVGASAGAPAGEVERDVELNRAPEVAAGERLRAHSHRLQKGRSGRRQERRQGLFVRRFCAECVPDVCGGEAAVQPRRRV